MIFALGYTAHAHNIGREVSCSDISRIANSEASAQKRQPSTLPWLRRNERYTAPIGPPSRLPNLKYGSRRRPYLTLPTTTTNDTLRPSDLLPMSSAMALEDGSTARLLRDYPASEASSVEAASSRALSNYFKRVWAALAAKMGAIQKASSSSAPNKYSDAEQLQLQGEQPWHLFSVGLANQSHGDALLFGIRSDSHGTLSRQMTTIPAAIRDLQTRRPKRRRSLSLSAN